MSRMSHRKDYNSIATEGVMMVLNSKWYTARTLFMIRKDENLLMATGYTIVSTLECLLSDMNIRCGLQSAQDTINKCKTANKLFDKSSQEPEEIFQYIFNEILQVHNQLCLSTLSIISGSDIIKSCWSVHQAWQFHKKLYRELVCYIKHQNEVKSQVKIRSDPKFMMSTENHLKSDASCDFAHIFRGFSRDFFLMAEALSVVTLVSEMKQKKRPSGIMGFLTSSKVTICGIDCTDVTLDRASLNLLVSLACFGYGLFLSALEFLPQVSAVQRLVSLFGFHDDQGDRFEAGMEKLMVASLSDTYVAPVSCCLLLHLLCVCRRFMVIDANCTASGEHLHRIKFLLKTFWKYDGGSSVFYFYFQSKMQLMERNLSAAVVSLKQGCEKDNSDMKLICDYELVKMSMIMFDWSTAAKRLDKMRKKADLVSNYQIYMVAMCYGAAGDLKMFQCLLDSIIKASKKKQKECSEFFAKRIQPWKMSSEENVATCTLYCFELLYLWNLLQVCTDENLEKIIHLCEANKIESCKGVCLLLLAVARKFLSRSREEKNEKNTSDDIKGIKNNDKNVKKKNINENEDGNSNKSHVEKGDDDFEKRLLEVLNLSKMGLQKPEDHILAFACYELAYLKSYQGEYKLSREYFLKMKNYDQKHLFFKIKIEAEIDRYIAGCRTSPDLPLFHLSSPSHKKIQNKTDHDAGKSLALKIFEGFVSREKVSPIAEFMTTGNFLGSGTDIDQIEFKLTTSSPLANDHKLSRKSVEVIVGDDDDDDSRVKSSDGNYKSISTAKSCVIQ